VLFNSYEFIFLFLPVALVVFFGLRRYRRTSLPALWLVVTSLGFYAYWRSAYLLLLIGSIILNYGAGLAIARQVGDQRLRRAKGLLIAAIAADLGLLAYFKYTDFFLGTINGVLGSDIPLQHIVLPLAVSFFTFNQIAFLVDVYRGYVHEYGFVNYALFIVFFPHLIAGPIVHHRDIIPQFKRFNFSFSSTAISLGLTIFSVGLFKKVVLADNVAPYADAIFNAAARQEILTLTEAWVGALAYTLQLYFDFSGYSDMAIGGALLFGVRFPWNFDAPYKAACIIDFWRRWHITLSEFLRDYLYIPLGGNHCGAFRRSLNILLTMLLGGLWHGANWTFVLWGGLHGFYVVINHLWRDWRARTSEVPSRPSAAKRIPGSVLTFLAVVAGWVMFRAENLSAAVSLYRSMIGLAGWSGWSTDPPTLLPHLASAAQTYEPFGWVAALLALCWFTPSLREQVEAYESGTRRRGVLHWSASRTWAVYSGLLAWLSIMFLARPTEFLYYQF